LRHKHYCKPRPHWDNFVGSFTGIMAYR
jgi:hypothetical protein